MSTEQKLGGPGQCTFCGGQFPNVGLHHATCAMMPMPRMNPPRPRGSESEVTHLTPTVSRIEQAKRYALCAFDEWNDVTGFVVPHCGYYSEITSLIEEAVEYGFGVAHGQTWKAIRKRINKE